MKILRWLGSEALYLVIIGALAAGLAASYAREREAHRFPGRQWLWNRLLIAPVLGITAAALSELLSLSLTMAAFATTMLSLGGFDALRYVESKWRERARSLVHSQPWPADLAQGPLHGSTTGARDEDHSDPRERPIRMLRDVVPLSPNSVEQAVLLNKLHASHETSIPNEVTKS